jgi:hypothetical protein
MYFIFVAVHWTVSSLLLQHERAGYLGYLLSDLLTRDE